MVRCSFAGRRRIKDSGCLSSSILSVGLKSSMQHISYFTVVIYGDESFNSSCAVCTDSMKECRPPARAGNCQASSFFSDLQRCL